ncbi:MAG: iron-containing redox enzyme family protein [Candidatus Nitrosopelagicus sp.]|jgi:pyrroloquinoline-quinone synthase|nr:iron-containing redox enzyme family protein [Candidatus Nitrosopelagicus sp.]
MGSLIKQIDQIIEEKSLLKHPFYEMWSDGKLELDSLKGYSKEYYQLVKQVPQFMEPLVNDATPEMKDELIQNMKEEAEHIPLWEKFAGSMGISESELQGYQGLEKTNKAVSNLDSLMNSYDNGACAMYAFEKEIPQVSQTKLEGLKEFYGIDTKDATEYFEEHMTADIRHAASWEKVINDTKLDDSLMLSTAQKSVDAQNLLLDSCYEAYC